MGGERVYRVDVWFSTSFPVVPDEDWRTVLVSATDPTQAELVACQVVARRGTPTRSSLVF